MLPHIQIKTLHGSADEYRAYAAVMANFSPQQFTDFELAAPAEIKDFDAGFARAGYFNRRYLATLPDGTPVGVGHVFRIPWLSATPRRFWSNLRVLPAWQRQGIGNEILHHIDADLHAQGADKLWQMVRESLPDLVQVVERNGGRELIRTAPYTLDVANSTPIDLDPVLDRLAERGLSIATLAELRECDPEWLAKLHVLHMSLSRDIPLPEDLFTTPDEFAEWVADSPTALPDAYFIVLDGERYVAQSFMQCGNTPDTLHQEVTGVLPGYRGCGIAQALKQLTIDYAQRHGFAQIVTWVESVNQTMGSINLKYGFTRGSGIILFERDAPLFARPMIIDAQRPAARIGRPADWDRGRRSRDLPPAAPLWS
jgi:GNAT superfamily N-acetyltransferase